MQQQPPHGRMRRRRYSLNSYSSASHSSSASQSRSLSQERRDRVNSARDRLGSLARSPVLMAPLSSHTKMRKNNINHDIAAFLAAPAAPAPAAPPAIPLLRKGSAFSTLAPTPADVAGLPPTMTMISATSTARTVQPICPPTAAFAADSSPTRELPSPTEFSSHSFRSPTPTGADFGLSSAPIESAGTLSRSQKNFSHNRKVAPMSAGSTFSHHHQPQRQAHHHQPQQQHQQQHQPQRPPHQHQPQHEHQQYQQQHQPQHEQHQYQPQQQHQPQKRLQQQQQQRRPQQQQSQHQPQKRLQHQQQQQPAGGGGGRFANALRLSSRRAPASSHAGVGGLSSQTVYTRPRRFEGQDEDTSPFDQNRFPVKHGRSQSTYLPSQLEGMSDLPSNIVVPNREHQSLSSPPASPSPPVFSSVPKRHSLYVNSSVLPIRKRSGPRKLPMRKSRSKSPMRSEGSPSNLVARGSSSRQLYARLQAQGTAPAQEVVPPMRRANSESAFSYASSNAVDANGSSSSPPSSGLLRTRAQAFEQHIVKMLTRVSTADSSEERQGHTTPTPPTRERDHQQQQQQPHPPQSRKRSNADARASSRPASTRDHSGDDSSSRPRHSSRTPPRDHQRRPAVRSFDATDAATANGAQAKAVPNSSANRSSPSTRARAGAPGGHHARAVSDMSALKDLGPQSRFAPRRPPGPRPPPVAKPPARPVRPPKPRPTSIASALNLDELRSQLPVVARKAPPNRPQSSNSSPPPPDLGELRSYSLPTPAPTSAVAGISDANVRLKADSMRDLHNATAIALAATVGAPSPSDSSSSPSSSSSSMSVSKRSKTGGKRKGSSSSSRSPSLQGGRTSLGESPALPPVPSPHSKPARPALPTPKVSSSDVKSQSPPSTPSSPSSPSAPAIPRPSRPSAPPPKPPKLPRMSSAEKLEHLAKSQTSPGNTHSRPKKKREPRASAHARGVSMGRRPLSAHERLAALAEVSTREERGEDGEEAPPKAGRPPVMMEDDDEDEDDTKTVRRVVPRPPPRPSTVVRNKVREPPPMPQSPYKTKFGRKRLSKLERAVPSIESSSMGGARPSPSPSPELKPGEGEDTGADADVRTNTDTQKKRGAATSSANGGPPDSTLPPMSSSRPIVPKPAKKGASAKKGQDSLRVEVPGADSDSDDEGVPTLHLSQDFPPPGMKRRSGEEFDWCPAPRAPVPDCTPRPPRRRKRLVVYPSPAPAATSVPAAASSKTPLHSRSQSAAVSTMSSLSLAGTPPAHARKPSALPPPPPRAGRQNLHQDTRATGLSHASPYIPDKLPAEDRKAGTTPELDANAETKEDADANSDGSEDDDGLHPSLPNTRRHARRSTAADAVPVPVVPAHASNPIVVADSPHTVVPESSLVNVVDLYSPRVRPEDVDESLPAFAQRAPPPQAAKPMATTPIRSLHKRPEDSRSSFVSPELLSTTASIASPDKSRRSSIFSFTSMMSTMPKVEVPKSPSIAPDSSSAGGGTASRHPKASGGRSPSASWSARLPFRRRMSLSRAKKTSSASAPPSGGVGVAIDCTSVLRSAATPPPKRAATLSRSLSRRKTLERRSSASSSEKRENSMSKPARTMPRMSPRAKSSSSISTYANSPQSFGQESPAPKMNSLSSYQRTSAPILHSAKTPTDGSNEVPPKPANSRTVSSPAAFARRSSLKSMSSINLSPSKAAKPMQPSLSRSKSALSPSHPPPPPNASSTSTAPAAAAEASPAPRHTRAQSEQPVFTFLSSETLARIQRDLEKNNKSGGSGGGGSLVARMRSASQRTRGRRLSKAKFGTLDSNAMRAAAAVADSLGKSSAAKSSTPSRGSFMFRSKQSSEKAAAAAADKKKSFHERARSVGAVKLPKPPPRKKASTAAARSVEPPPASSRRRYRRATLQQPISIRDLREKAAADDGGNSHSSGGS